VQQGDVLPNGMRVVSIGPRGVVVRNSAGKDQHLAMAGTTSGLPNSGFSVAAPSLPPLPPSAPNVPRGPSR
jgi:hypothetical protein